MIYLVEDDISVVSAFELFLESAEMEYKSFESANIFLAQIILEQNDLLVLDLNLPGMNGCELLKTFVKKNIHIPVIVVTSFDEHFSRECCRQYGVKAYLRKPVDGEALIDLIKSILPL